MPRQHSPVHLLCFFFSAPYSMLRTSVSFLLGGTYARICSRIFIKMLSIAGNMKKTSRNACRTLCIGLHHRIPWQCRKIDCEWPKNLICSDPTSGWIPEQSPRSANGSETQNREFMVGLWGFGILRSKSLGFWVFVDRNSSKFVIRRNFSKK